MWRKTLGPPPPSDEARSTLTSMHKAVMSLAIGDWDCQILAQDMPYNLAGYAIQLGRIAGEYMRPREGIRTGHERAPRTWKIGVFLGYF